MLFAGLFVVVGLCVIIALVVIAGRSLRARKGSQLKRSREEEAAVSHIVSNTGRFGGSGPA